MELPKAPGRGNLRAMNQSVIGWALLLAFGCMGCKDSQSPPPSSPLPAPAAAAANYSQLHLDHAQHKLPTLKVWLGTNELETELALSVQQLSTGMMFRTNMEENEAMLFVFGQPCQASFYMKNTLVPLSAAYIDPVGVILEIHDLKPKDETAVPAATDQVQYVLEVNQGWFARHHVATGAVVRTSRGGLRETFFRNN